MISPRATSTRSSEAKVLPDRKTCRMCRKSPTVACWRCSERQLCARHVEHALIYIDYVDRSFAGLFRIDLCGTCARQPHNAYADHRNYVDVVNTLLGDRKQ